MACSGQDAAHPSLDRVRTGTPQGTAARSSWALVSESSVVAHLAQSLDQHLRACLLSLLIFSEVIHRWTLVSDMSGGKLLVSHWQIARLLPGGRGGEGRSRRGAAVGGGGAAVGGGGRGRRGVVSSASGEEETSGGGCQAWSAVAEVQKGGLRGVSRALAG